ncbi:MAG: flagellar hook-associated protein FlgL [Gammaproteobacteria bacterium]|nr:MAG: flagellar hook-associated protein FlgL [Gammaproteobacteria bacterium]
MTRISSFQMHQNAINAMLKQHETLSRTQQQVATGKKIFKPSEDPVAASRVVNLNDTLSAIDQHQSNVDAARARISLSEGVLSHVVESIHRARELAIQANNDSQNESTRSFIAAEIEQIQEALLNLANTTDSNNEFLYSGGLSRFKPFSRNEAGGFEYNGDESHREIQISGSRRIAVDDPGSEVFLAIKNGNGVFSTLDGLENKGSGIIDPGRATGNYKADTYGIIFNQSFAEFADKQNSQDIPLTYSVVDSKGTILSSGIPFEPGKEIAFNGVHTSIKGAPEDGDVFVVKPSQNQDIFTTMQNLIRALKSKAPEARDNISFHNAMNRSLTDLNRSLDNILEVRGSIGARLNALDSQETINDAYRIQIREILSNVEDLDFAEAVSRLNLELTGLEASQKAFTRVQDISLFNFL